MSNSIHVSVYHVCRYIYMSVSARLYVCMYVRISVSLSIKVLIRAHHYNVEVTHQTEAHRNITRIFFHGASIHFGALREWKAERNGVVTRAAGIWNEGGAGEGREDAALPACRQGKSEGSSETDDSEGKFVFHPFAG